MRVTLETIDLMSRDYNIGTDIITELREIAEELAIDVMDHSTHCALSNRLVELRELLDSIEIWDLDNDALRNRVSDYIEALSYKTISEEV